MLLNEQTAVQLGDKKVLGVRQGDKFILGRNNLVPNGQGRYTSGTIEVRRNYSKRPTSRWGGDGGTAVLSTITGASDGPGGLPTYTRKTWTVIWNSLLDIAFDIANSTNAIAVTPGEVWTHSLYLRSSRTISYSSMSEMAILYFNSSGVQVGSLQFGTTDRSDIVAGEWHRYWITSTVPSGAASVQVYIRKGIDQAQWSVGDYLDCGAPLSEKSSILGDAFDGSYSPDPDLTPSWTGTANASASVLTGRVVTSVSPTFNNMRNIQSQVWPNDGTSIRVIPRTNNNDTFADPGGGPGGIRLGLVKGKPVAVKALGYLPQIQKGTLNSAARRVSIVTRVGDIFSYTLGTVGANAVGEFSSEVSTTIPETATEAFIRINNGASVGNGEVYWTDVRVCQADTEAEALRMVRAPYRDGDFPGWTWDGTPGQSASRGLS